MPIIGTIAVSFRFCYDRLGKIRVFPNSMLTVFVYGTLKPGECNHAAYCLPGLASQRSALVPGQLFHLPSLGYPGLVDGPGWVQGVVLQWAGPQAAIDRRLAQLDALEDYDPRWAGKAQGPNFYDRQWRGVYRRDTQGQSHFLTYAWVYLLGRDRVRELGGVWLPEGVWSARGLGLTVP